MRERAELTDVVLEVEGRSPYFRTMFTSGYVEAKQERITIKEVSKVAMATILDYAYTGHLKMEPDQVQDVMSAAKLLQIDFVDRKAAEYMKDHLDVSNCADVLMYADMLGDVGLQEASGRYIAFRFNQVVLEPAFLQVPLPLLQSLLIREDLITDSEDDVVQAALRWVEFDKEKRLQHLPALCRCFRQSFISSNQRVELESKCLPTGCKLAYSDITTLRQGQTRTEMQIFPRLLKEGYNISDQDFHWVAPCYDPSTGRLHTMDIPEDLESISVTATPNDELYLAGYISRGVSQYSRQTTFYQYNHLTNTWEPRCEMISPRARCGLVYLKGYIYAIGGDETKETAERYDPSCDEWTSIPAIPQSMSSELCAVTLDDSIYVISKEGCYCFSTTENKWSKIADMLKPPLRPQAITHQGSIYCVDSNNESGVEVYNPSNGEWKWSETTTFHFDMAMLMEYGETMYLLTIYRHHNHQEQWISTTIYQYQPETDHWQDLEDEELLIPPLEEWLYSGSRTDCLTTRMIPMCLGDPDAYDELDILSSSSESSGSGISDVSDSVDGLSDEENT
uniref:BTB domain-containing protein n=1 Tax=Branchiostoma floridae TaxID=7739 RepID=C3Z688_BRAFL|eukprot:XP_002595911.1 hypothetical protein BRAFLDRAFT_98559 [Branchiostoma floridae]